MAKFNRREAFTNDIIASTCNVSLTNFDHFTTISFSTCLSSCACSLWFKNKICPQGRNWFTITEIFSDFSIN